MLIKCPKCGAIYDLPENIISSDGRTMRCAECHEIWTAHAEDALDPPKKEKNNDIRKMFERVSQSTSSFFDEQPPRVVEKIKVVNITRYKYTINIILFLIALLSILGILYYMRYEIVRLLPQTEKIYNKMDLTGIPYGKNLEFQSITTKEFSDNNIAKIEISGAIVNIGKYQTAIPPLKIEVFDKNNRLLTKTIHKLPLPYLEEGYHILFNVVITNPTPSGKSIYVKFQENQ